MRIGLTVSVIGHAALVAWGIVALPHTTPLDASDIEAVPVEFVELGDVTDLRRGLRMAALVQEPQTEEPDAVAEPPPLPKPTPPPPAPPVAETPPEPPAPQPPPVAETPPPPPPPEPVAEAPPPEPAPVPKPEPEPPPEMTERTFDPVPRPRMAPPRPAARTAEQTPRKQFDIDQITAMLDEQPAPQPDASESTIGSTIGAADARMTQTELDTLRARLAQCWSPPIGWTDPSEVRVVVILYLNADGSISRDPQVLEGPGGRYAQTAPESALRAVRRCAPYKLPVEKFETWREVKVTFDPTDMSGV